jgi:hypothetical protein
MTYVFNIKSTLTGLKQQYTSFNDCYFMLYAHFSIVLKHNIFQLYKLFLHAFQCSQGHEILYNYSIYLIL